MTDGFILLDNNNNVISINNVAASIIEADEKSINQQLFNIIHNAKSNKAIKDALLNDNGESFFDSTYEKYRIEINSVYNNNSVIGKIILIYNITEKENSEIMRREFSANVSHELKTPLQSISGYAELLSNGLVRTEDTVNFGGKIYSEAQRMIHLIDDIIHLSRLDEGAGEMSYSIVDIHKVALETADNLSSEAKNADVEIIVSGIKSEISAIPHLIVGILFNLCDNAIKYNKKGGKVYIDIQNRKNYIQVSVKDTGIGIPKEDFARIFERFYRVDKSHSKEVGGTGLGLSIVKHAAIIHNAKLELESTLNVGTTVTVIFPKQ